MATRIMEGGKEPKGQRLEKRLRGEDPERGGKGLKRSGFLALLVEGECAVEFPGG